MACGQWPAMAIGKKKKGKEKENGKK